jgi:hypothetical protein
MTLRAQRVRRAGARHHVSRLGQLLALLPCLAACSLDDRLLHREQASGFGGDSGFLLPFEAGSGGKPHGSGGHRPMSTPHDDAATVDDASADAADDAAFGDGGGCFHRNVDGSLDCSDTLVTNADFNRNAAGWEGFNDFELSWDSSDSQGARQSGSLSVKNTHKYTDIDGVLVAGATQCVPVAAGDAYDFSVHMFIPKGQLPGAVGILAVWLYQSPDCADIDSAYTLLATDVVDKWQLATGQGLGIPPKVVSMKILLEAQKPFRWEDPFEVDFDAVRVMKRAASSP